MKALWAWPFGARQWHIRAEQGEYRTYSSGKALCGTHYAAWAQPRPGRDDDDARCCPKCRAELRRMEAEVGDDGV